ncbi:S41 family peptidase, partial [Actinosynnema sp. NPDC020468]|uniref:S41 family peptidase n=1 Tax=Actinosynnema sp. NPDC020468 TaxID=3154488 RepID=UPI00340B8F99
MDTAPIIARTRSLLVEHYVFPDVAAELADLLGRREYRAGTPEELARAVTADLQSVNGDLHLRLKHHATPVPEEDDAASLQEITRKFDLSLGGVPGVRRLPGGVAHLELAPSLFPIEWAGDVLAAAFTLVARAEALVLDLRANLGGDPHTVALVCGYLFDEPTHVNSIHHREGDRWEQFWSPGHVAGTPFGQTRPVYVLTSGRTFSGAEELAYDLQQRGRATVVGERTGGGAHPRRGFTVHPNLEVTIPIARAVNPVSGTNWEGVGVLPDVEVPESRALERAHHEALTELARRDGDTPSL